MPPPELIESRI